MSYELRKPITDEQRNNFIVGYNHKLGLEIEDTDMFLFALEKNEIMGEKDIEIEIPDFEIEDIEVQIHDTDEKGEYIYDDEGNPVTHTETRPVQKQVGTHTETVTIPYPVLNPDYEREEQEKERQRLDMLSLTKREVFLALYRAKGITPDMVRGSITDEEALIEFDYAERFFRGNPLIDKIGIMLGYSTEDLDHLFEYKELPETVENEGESAQVTEKELPKAVNSELIQ